jgi:hypothetical protein
VTAPYRDHDAATTDPPSPLRIAPLLATLDNYRVNYVVIGGVAAQLHGDAHPTYGLDIAPDTNPSNLEQLRHALIDIGAREYVPGFGYPLQLPMDRRRLSTDVPLLSSTRHGPLDVIPKPHGFPSGYMRLVGRMRLVPAYGLLVPTAHRSDLIDSHLAAGRVKDASIVVRLRALDDRIRDRGALPPHEQPRDLTNQPATHEPEVHAAFAAAETLATVFDDVRPALAAARRNLYHALDDAQYGDPAMAARRIDIARSAVDAAQEFVTGVRRQLQPEAMRTNLEAPPVLLEGSNGLAMLAYQAHEEISLARRLLSDLEPHRLHTLDAHDMLIESRIHAASADASLDLLQIQLERAARAWEIQNPGDACGPEL